ncbi:MAG: hypothetical protein LOD91_10870, partial [Limnochordales bacterium]
MVMGLSGCGKSTLLR